MAAVIRYGRLCGVLKAMINGSWVGERLQIDIVRKGVIRNGSVFFMLVVYLLKQFTIQIENTFMS